jgi:hypothetical protein
MIDLYALPGRTAGPAGRFRRGLQGAHNPRQGLHERRAPSFGQNREDACVHPLAERLRTLQFIRPSPVSFNT